MELSVTNEGYIRCVAGNGEHILSEQITGINASNLSLPCMRDRYESNVLFYHIGDNISVYDYLRSKIMDFDSLKELVINLGDVFIKLEEAGLHNQKIIADIRYIFISPSTKQLKVMQCPIEEYSEPASYQKVVDYICYNIKSENAYVAMGYILEGIRQDNFNIRNFVKRVSRLENSIGKVQTEQKQIQKQIETKVIEKRILVNKTSYGLCIFFSILLEIIGIMLLPYLFKEIIGLSTLVSDISSAGVVVIFTIIIFCIMRAKSKGETVDSIQQINNITPMGNARMGQSVIKEMTQQTFINNNVDEDSFDKTGILEEEVEINPLKRQEMYSKNAVPIVYLVEEETNKKHQIRKNKFLVGRSKDCDLSINSTVVSKKHAEIVYENNEYYVRDLESSNYTYLNKATIEPMELYKIEDGSRIGFGNKWFIFKTNL